MKVIKYSKLSNYQLKKIMNCFCMDIDATKTGKLLEFHRNITTYYFKLFREAIYLHQSLLLDKFYGDVDVELDESYFGAKRIRGYHGKLKRGIGTLKQPVFGIFERTDEFGHKRVYTEIVPDCKKKTLQATIRHKIDLRSVKTTTELTDELEKIFKFYIKFFHLKKGWFVVLEPYLLAYRLICNLVYGGLSP